MPKETDVPPKANSQKWMSRTDKKSDPEEEFMYLDSGFERRFFAISISNCKSEESIGDLNGSVKRIGRDISELEERLKELKKQGAQQEDIDNIIKILTIMRSCLRRVEEKKRVLEQARVDQIIAQALEDIKAAYEEARIARKIADLMRGNEALMAAITLQKELNKIDGQIQQLNDRVKYLTEENQRIYNNMEACDVRIGRSWHNVSERGRYLDNLCGLCPKMSREEVKEVAQKHWENSDMDEEDRQAALAKDLGTTVEQVKEAENKTPGFSEEAQNRQKEVTEKKTLSKQYAENEKEIGECNKQKGQLMVERDNLVGVSQSAQQSVAKQTKQTVEEVAALVQEKAKEEAPKAKEETLEDKEKRLEAVKIKMAPFEQEMKKLKREHMMAKSDASKKEIQQKIDENKNKLNPLKEEKKNLEQQIEQLKQKTPTLGNEQKI